MLHFVDITITCAQDAGKIRKSTLSYSDSVDGKTIYRPFAGCEFMNGLPACQKCCDTVNQFLETFPNPETLCNSCPIGG